MDDINNLRQRISELEQKEAARSQRFNKFINRARQALIIILGAVEDWGSLGRTIPPRKDR
jgi:hypothetical protein